MEKSFLNKVPTKKTFSQIAQQVFFNLKIDFKLELKQSLELSPIKENINELIFIGLYKSFICVLHSMKKTILTCIQSLPICGRHLRFKLEHDKCLSFKNFLNTHLIETFSEKGNPFVQVLETIG